MAAVEEDDDNNHGNNSSQSDSCTDSTGDHTPELLSLEDLRTNTYDFTSVDMVMPSSSISDHDNPTVTMEITEGKVITTRPSTTNTTTATSRAVTTSTISHSTCVKSVTDSGIAAGSSVEISTQLRDDFSNHLQGSCNVSEQLNIRRYDSKIPSSSSATLSHNTIAKSNSGKEGSYYSSAVDSGLGYNLKTTSHAHNGDESVTVQSHLLTDVDYQSVPVSWSSSTVDSSGTTSSLLPAKYHPPVEESTPKSRHGMPAHSYTNDKNRWAWLPRYTSTNGESFSSFAEGVILKKEMLKSQLQFGKN